MSGESGALISAMNGHEPLPPRRKIHASKRGIGAAARPCCATRRRSRSLRCWPCWGPEAYASAGDPAEPGTLLLTVGGAVARPAVVEVPSGWPLGDVLDLCGAGPADGVLVGGYHGSWLPAETAYEVPVSRAGLAAAGGTLGPGVVLALRPGQLPAGRGGPGRRVPGQGVVRSVRAVQAGPARHRAFELAALASGLGGGDALDLSLRGAAGGARPRRVRSSRTG